MNKSGTVGVSCVSGGVGNVGTVARSENTIGPLPEFVHVVFGNTIGTINAGVKVRLVNVPGTTPPGPTE